MKGEPVVFGPKGCKKCNSTGYLGRIGIFEVFEMTEQLGEIIVKDPTEKALALEVKRQSMLTMEDDGIIKVLQGVTSLQEIMRTSREGQ